jgi:hypothetical protein
MRKPQARATTAEELELALAYLRGDVTGRQVAEAVGVRSQSNSRFWAFTVLTQATKAGLIEITLAQQNAPQGL